VSPGQSPSNDRYNTEQSIDIIARLFRGDGGAKIATVLAESGEPWPQGLEAYRKTYEATKSSPPTVEKLWDTQVERLIFVKKTLEHWVATKSHTGTGRPIDGLLSPTTPWAACPKDGFDFHIAYTGIWNLTDQSATTFPVGVSTTEDVISDGFTGRNDLERKIWSRCKCTLSALAHSRRSGRERKRSGWTADSRAATGRRESDQIDRGRHGRAGGVGLVVPDYDEGPVGSTCKSAVFY